MKSSYLLTPFLDFLFYFTFFANFYGWVSCLDGFLQKARIQIWLFEQKDLRIEGRIIVSLLRFRFMVYFCSFFFFLIVLVLVKLDLET